MFSPTILPLQMDKFKGILDIKIEESKWEEPLK